MASAWPPPGASSSRPVEEQGEYQADPLVCKGCEGPLKIVAYITDEISIKRILDHVGLSPPEQEKPEPP